MFKAIKRLWGYFTNNSAASLAKEQLEDDKRRLLKHQSSAAYNKKMAEYYQENIKRLENYGKTVDASLPILTDEV